MYLILGSALIVALALALRLQPRLSTPVWLEQFRAEPLQPDTIPNELKQYRRKLQEQLSRIHPDDGMDSSEALEAAQIYMGEYITGCGGPEKPQLIDGRWRSELRVGLTGQHSSTVIDVDAKTGGVSSSGGPRFATFREFADDVVSGVVDRIKGRRTSR